MTTIGGGERIRIVVSGARGRVGDVNPLTLAAEAAAEAAADAAENYYNAAVTAITLASLSNPYPTNAAADAAAAAGTLAANAYCYVMVDSTRKGAPSIRQRVGTATSTTFVLAVGAVADGFQTTVPVVASNAYQQAMLKAPAPTSGMTGTSGINDAVTGVVQVSAGRLTNGPSGATNYYNSVVGLGINSTTAWTPDNPALPSASFRIEAKYAIGSKFYTEIHASAFSKDNPGTELRSFSAIVPHNESDWAANSDASLRGARIGFNDGSGASRTVFDYVNNVVLFEGSGSNNLRISFNKNGPVGNQLNSAGNSYLNLPYFNSSDALVLPGPHLCIGSMKSLPELGMTAMFGYNCANAVADGAFMLLVPSAGVTGNLWGLRALALSVSGTYRATEFANNHASGHIEDRRFANGNILTTLQNYASGYYEWQHGSIYATNLWILSSGGQNALEVHGSTGNLNIARGKLKIAGTQVLSTQQSAIANLAGGADLATTVSKVNAILAMLRTHGLIAT